MGNVRDSFRSRVAFSRRVEVSIEEQCALISTLMLCCYIGTSERFPTQKRVFGFAYTALSNHHTYCTEFERFPFFCGYSGSYQEMSWIEHGPTAAITETSPKWDFSTFAIETGQILPVKTHGVPFLNNTISSSWSRSEFGKTSCTVPRRNSSVFRAVSLWRRALKIILGSEQSPPNTVRYKSGTARSGSLVHLLVGSVCGTSFAIKASRFVRVW